MLPPRAGRPEDLHLNIGGVEGKVHLIHLGQHRHRDGGGVDASAGLGLRHPLYPVDTALKFQAAVSPFSVNGKADLLDPAQLGVTETGDLHIPAPGLGVHGIHTVEGICK